MRKLNRQVSDNSIESIVKCGMSLPCRWHLSVFGEALFVFGILLYAAQAHAFDPPVIISELRGGVDSVEASEQFLWIGDQNEDGYDDLLVLHSQYQYAGLEDAIKIFYGGERFNNQPDFVIRDQQYENLGGGEALVYYAGQLTPDNSHWIFIGVARYESERPGPALDWYSNLYKGGEELDTIPDIVFGRSQTRILAPRNWDRNKPSDFNGDGYHDLLLAECEDSPEIGGRLLMYFGGEDFDTIPDCVYTINIRRWNMLGLDWASGGDLNNDGYDDFLVMRSSAPDIYFFLGGDPMDTVAALHIRSARDEYGLYTLKDYCILSDVNGDGYDDWAFSWAYSDINNQNPDRNGYYLFYGGDSLDFEPDVILQEDRQMGHEGRIIGGDFNGDGFGDIVTTNGSSYHAEGEMHIHFGSENMTPNADISFNVMDVYGDRYAQIGAYLGGVGDYDGDGQADFVATCPLSFGGVIYKLLVFSAAEDWVSVTPSVYPEPVDEWRLNVQLSPNPFNSTLSVTINNLRDGELEITLFELNGKEVWQNKMEVAGNVSETIQIGSLPLSAGIYLVRTINRTRSGIISSQFHKAVHLR